MYIFSSGGMGERDLGLRRSEGHCPGRNGSHGLNVTHLK